MVQDLLKKCAQSMFCYVRDLGYHPTFFEFSPSKIEFTVFSENNAYDYGRFLAIILLGISYLICFCFVFLNQNLQNKCFGEVNHNESSK